MHDVTTYLFNELARNLSNHITEEPDGDKADRLKVIRHEVDKLHHDYMDVHEGLKGPIPMFDIVSLTKVNNGITVVYANGVMKGYHSDEISITYRGD